MKHSVLRELVAFVFFLLAAVMLTWPLVAHIDSAISDPGDPYVSMAIMEWDLRATLHHPARLFHQPIFHPSPYALAFTEHLYGTALPVMPFYLAGVPLIAMYNISVLLGFALCGYGAYLVGRLLTGSFAAGLVGGLFFEFVPYRITQIPHISYVWAGWLALLLAALLYYDQKPSTKRAAIFGGVFFMNGLTTVTWLAMGAVAALVSALYLKILRGRDWRYLIRLGFAALAALILLLPFILPYNIARDMYKMRRSPEETQFYSAEWRDWFVAESYLAYGHLLNNGTVDPERWLFPGFVPLILAASGLFLYRAPFQTRDSEAPTRDGVAMRILDVLVTVVGIWAIFELAARNSWSNLVGSRLLLRVGANPLAPMLFLVLLLTRLCLRIPGTADRSLLDLLRRSRFSPGIQVSILWLILGVLGSLGLNSFFYAFLFDYVGLFRSIRVPARWAMVAYVALAALISCGVAALARKGWRWTWVPIAAAALLVLELSPAPCTWYLSNLPPPSVYSWLAETPLSGAILELPVAQNQSEYAYLRWAPLHRKSMVGGVSSFGPKSFEQLVTLAHQDPIENDLLPRLEEVRCSIIVVHADWLGPNDQSTREWLARQIRAGRLTFVRRFPHDQRGDYVFALTRTEPQATFWREPEHPDRTGTTPLAHLRAFLDGNRPTYFDSTLAGFEGITPSDLALGEMNIAGWAVSPHDIREVNLRFFNGAVVIPADRYARPEISKYLPWYPETTMAGFRKSFANRPDWGAREDGDLQIEIVDGRGERKLLDPVFFNWRDRDQFRIRDWNRQAMNELIYRLYRRHDIPEVRRARKTGLTFDEIVYALIENNRKKNDRDFIDKCYHVLFNRPADDAGMSLHMKALSEGKPRRQVVRSLIRSPEFRRIYFNR